jgi:hypothetical protein
MCGSLNAAMMCTNCVALVGILGWYVIIFCQEKAPPCLKGIELHPTNVLIFTSYCSTFAPLVGSGDYHQADKVYTLLAVFRAILGFGVGGKCELS